MSRQHFSPRFFGCLLLLSAALGSPLLAADAKAKTTIDPKAQKVADAFSKYILGLKGFKMTSNIALRVEQQGRRQEYEFVQKFSAERPNKLNCVLESPQAGAEIVSDGRKLSVFLNQTNKYASEDAPATWEGILQNPLVIGALSMGNAAVTTSALLDVDPAKKLFEKVDSVSYGGIVSLGERKCHLIKATSAELDWELWIDAGDKPLPRQFVPDLTKALAQAAKQAGNAAAFANMKASNVVTFDDWEVNPKFPADAFAFNAPEGATKAKTILDIVMGDREETGPHPLLAKAAPAIKLDLLDGGKFDLASYKNKKIVILDFWATWCGPCAQAMPIIDKVAKKFEKNGVLLFGVNIQEEPDEVHKFLEDRDLKLPIVLDSEGTAAKAYMATGIPQTVLVGKDGTVQVVLIGLSPNLEEELTKDLEALVAGKNLAAEALAAAKAKADSADDKTSEDAEKK